MVSSRYYIYDYIIHIFIYVGTNHIGIATDNLVSFKPLLFKLPQSILKAEDLLLGYPMNISVSANQLIYNHVKVKVRNIFLRLFVTLSQIFYLQLGIVFLQIESRITIILHLYKK